MNRPKEMKKNLIVTFLLLVVIAFSALATSHKGKENNMETNKILFINSSPNVNGNTAALAKELLRGKDFETLNLTDYRINVYGQTLDGEQFDEVMSKLKEAQIVVIGSPVYWHNMAGSVRTLLDRFYGPVQQGELKGRKLFFIYQGAAPEEWMLKDGEYTMKRFASLYGFSYEGMATNRKEARALSGKVR